MRQGCQVTSVLGKWALLRRRGSFSVMAGGILMIGLALGVGARAETAGGMASAQWPGLRGAGGYGHADGAQPPITWNAKEGENVLWSTAVDRHGMSSPILAGERLFITAADYEVRQVLCYDANTGELRWSHEVKRVAEQDLPRVLEETGYAASTPVTDGKHVVAVFGTGELVCLDVEGARVWEKELGIPENHYGHASSLISYENLVIVQYDQNENARLLAFEMGSGKLAWEVSREVISWSSPILVKNGDRMEVIVTNGEGVESYDPRSGRSLWRVECPGGEVAPSAAYADGIVFVASEGGTAAAIDVSEHAEEPRILWQWEDALPDAASPLAQGGLLIIPTAFGVVTCLDARTGEVHWEHEFDRGFNSSPILAGDRVYITDMSGTTQIFRMANVFELMGTASVGEPVYATPAFVGQRVYLRGVSRLYGLAEKDPAEAEVEAPPPPADKPE